MFEFKLQMSINECFAQTINHKTSWSQKLFKHIFLLKPPFTPLPRPQLWLKVTNIELVMIAQ